MTDYYAVEVPKHGGWHKLRQDAQIHYQDVSAHARLIWDPVKRTVAFYGFPKMSVHDMPTPTMMDMTMFTLGGIDELPDYLMLLDFNGGPLSTKR